MGYRIESQTFVEVKDDIRTKTIRFIGKELYSEEWRKKQEASIEEYIKTQELDINDEQIKNLYILFRGYISYWILTYKNKKKDNIKMLDVGCGISNKIPLYIRGLESSIIYVGLDPIKKNMDRDYLFINSRIEDICNILEDKEKFDFFLFSTSLDHFENIEKVAEIIKKISYPGAMALFFLGLHDSVLVARGLGAKFFGELYSDLRIPGFCINFFKGVFLKIPFYYSFFRKREFKLKKKVGLDDKHFYFFTKETIIKTIKLFGEIKDIVSIPNSNVQFISCEVKIN